MKNKTISSGIGIGKALILKNQNFDYEQKTIEENINLYQSKKESAIAFLNLLISKNPQSDVLNFQIAVLNDQAFTADIVRRIKMKKPVDLAFHQAMKHYIEALTKLNDPYFNERIADLEDLSKRLFMPYQALNVTNPNEPVILYVDELYPSMLFEYIAQIKGVVAKKGSSLSHAAILMKERNIPFILSDDVLKANETYLLNGFDAAIIENPTVFDIKAAQTHLESNQKALSLSHKPYKLYLNMSGQAKVDQLLNKHSDGIGLYRSEFLYHIFNDFPTLEYQYDIYTSLLKSFYPKSVVIRTYDFSDDKQMTKPVKRGVAGYLLHFEKAFKEQLSSLLLANEVYGNLKIMIPMVYRIDDYKMVIKMLKWLKKALNLKKPLPPVGVMIETQEAFMYLEEFSKVDFISVGTNDLGAELFGFKRTKKEPKDYYQKLSSAISDIIQFGLDKQIPVTICGDIASQPKGIETLIKIGAKQFSIAQPFLPEAKKIIQNFK